MASSDQKPVVPGAASGTVDAFLDQVNRLPGAHAGAERGRLIFALDATMSRQPTWDLAQSLQGRMFQTASNLGGLDVQLLYFRGFAECRASRFIANGVGLAELMAKISVAGGNTQIAKVLRHVREETNRKRVAALIYVGDAMEENADELCQLAGELGLLGVKAFMFHEGNEPTSAATFREIARLTGGAYAHFDASAPHRLGEMLAAAAAYAAGGRKALEQIASQGSQSAQALLRQMK
ncbi:VWA domain-containing protein [Methylocella sp. CPCC 101449]|uniref:VWA domain-containing protein n=1 Tax=Methylocella sp. CPCC 101449 TaxID=2987531 RepID=UPI0028926298|nr:VWA domain-containing protein [Methylocella sp. CPCC 101449]MDT2022675.1 VWA domain-containing protein [Methylocella sp. CPCC 101449]